MYVGTNIFTVVDFGKVYKELYDLTIILLNLAAIFSYFNDTALVIPSLVVSFEASMNKCITRAFIRISSIDIAVFNCPNRDGGHLGFSRFLTFPLHVFCGTFFYASWTCQ